MYCANFQVLDQHAAFKISFNDSLLQLGTFDDDEDLVECSLMVVISFPDFSNTSCPSSG